MASDFVGRSVRRGLLLGVVMVLAVAGVAGASTLKVTTTKDSKDAACTAKKCSLRDAVTFAKAGDTVVLPASSKPYVVSLGEVKVLQPLTVKGAGASKSVIKGNGKSRVFEVVAKPASSATVTFMGVTITGGHATKMPGGGAILVDGVSPTVALNLVINRSAITGNTAAVSTGGNSSAGGGGIYSNGGDITLIHSSVSHNVAKIKGSTGTGAPRACCDGGGGVYNNAGSIHVSGSTLASNMATVTGYYCCHGGGAIYSNGGPLPNGNITISRSRLTNNSVTVKGTKTDVSGSFGNCCSGGGAVYQDSFATSITRSTLAGNKATISSGQCCHGGGAVYGDTQTPMTVTRSTVSNNRSTVNGPSGQAGSNHCCSGGGAASLFGGIGLTNSTVSNNTASVTAGNCCQGGGAFNIDSTGATGGVTSRGSTISGNRAVISGGTLSGAGGIYEDTSSSASSTYTNSTLSGNSTSAAGTDNGGGALYVYQGSSTGVADVLANVTLAGNSASHGFGGGVFNLSSLVNSKNSIVALNSAKHGANCAGATYSADTPPVFASMGYNLTNSPDSCNFVAPGDRVVKASAVKLGPLANNGGPTKTRAELKGSATIDHGNPAGCTSATGAPLSTDQRGRQRPDRTETRCDIGAYEYQDKSAK